MPLKGKIETFTGTGPGGRRLSKLLDENWAPNGKYSRSLTLREGDIRLNELNDSAEMEKLENIYNTEGLGVKNPAYESSTDGDPTPSPQTTTIVSFVIDGQEQNTDGDKSSGNLLDKKSASVTVLLSVLYAIVITLIGTLYPISEAIKGEWMNEHVVAAFQVYLFFLSTAFLIYLQVEVYLHDRKHQKHQQPQNAPNGTSSPLNVSLSEKDAEKDAANPNMVVFRRRKNTLNDLPELPEVEEEERKSQPSTSESEDTGNVSMDIDEEVYEQISFQTQTATLSHEAASIYLRLGALLFGVGNVVLVALQFYFGHDEGIKCPYTRQIYPMICQMLFLIIQTFFILKHTHIHITHRKGLARFGLMHVLATNLCVWIRILVTEVQEGVHHSSAGHHDVHEDGYGGYGNSSSKHNVTTVYTPSSSCGAQNTLLQQASPFLFPCVLEYSLITVAVMAGMFEGLYIQVSQDVIEMIRKTLRLRSLREKQALATAARKDSIVQVTHMFDKSHKGLYLGVLVLTGTIISIVLFFFHLNTLHDDGNAMVIFHATDIAIHTVLILAVVLALSRFLKLHFTIARNNTIDDRLLILSFAGLFLFEGFIMFSSIATMVNNRDMTNAEATQTALALAACFVNIIQALLQTIFVIDGLQRCSVKVEHRKHKPGRGFITFLIISNVALWIFKTFQIKEVGLSTQAAYYGGTSWAIILNINLPLMLFFRFHSSVCMADIWTSAYEDEHNDLGLQVLQ